MTRMLAAALVLLLVAPVAAQARPGDPDRGFGRRGTLSLKAKGTDAVGGAVKVIAGNRVLAGGSAGGQFVVVRLRRTGALDRQFGTAGQVVPALPGTSLDGVRALATFRDGRIVAAGTLRLTDGTTRIAAVRLLPSGEIDPSFGGGLGYVLAGPANAVLGAMVMDRAGNVILGGSRGQAPIVLRLLADGSVDTSFGTFDASEPRAGRPRHEPARAPRGPDPVQRRGRRGDLLGRAARSRPARPTRRSPAPASRTSRSARAAPPASARRPSAAARAARRSWPGPT